MRLDRDANEVIGVLEMLNFFKDNREFTIGEADCNNLLCYFDSDEDGCLSF